MVSLYKYQPVTDTTLGNLINHQLWFAIPSTFNDPYDCAFMPIIHDSDGDCVEYFDTCWARATTESDKAFYEKYKDDKVNATRERLEDVSRRLLEQERNKFLTSWGIACFAEENDTMLMWSHYTNGHKGFCLVFDISSNFFKGLLQVNYSETIPSVRTIPALLGKEPPNIVRTMITTKAKCWEYEHEYRLAREQGGKPYIYEPRNLLGIYFGVAMESQDKEVIAKILHGLPTKLYEMVKSETDFRLTSRPYIAK